MKIVSKKNKLLLLTLMSVVSGSDRRVIKVNGHSYINNKPVQVGQLLKDNDNLIIKPNAFIITIDVEDRSLSKMRKQTVYNKNRFNITMPTSVASVKG